MWTNVFRIGELHAVSWFQFLPYESDPNPISEKSSREDQKDATASLVLNAHLQLQKSGFLSTWTNSFVGPWDPSQGVHNPDEKIKVWLFLPGRHSSLNETAQAAVSKLRVVGTGVWLAPGDSEEVNVAFTRALRNSIERALRGLSYVRFGDVFTRCHSSFSNSHNFRRTQPTVEFVFSVTEDAIYAHAIISAKHIRGLNSDDMERVSKHHSSTSMGEGLPVMVAPNGMQGRVTGLYPSDLVKQVYMSKLKASKGQAIGLPFDVAHLSSCQLRGQSCYLEVSLGCSSTYGDKTSDSIINQNKNAQLTILQRTFIYQPEAALVPLMHKAFARTSYKRFYRKKYAGTALSELWPLWSDSGSWPIEYCLGFGSDFSGQLFGGLEANKRYNSSSNSNSSSLSSVSSTSRENDNARSIGGSELEADADSRGSKRSSSTSKDQLENDNRMTKRLRTGNTDTFDQSGKLVPQEANKFAFLGFNYRSFWDLGDDDDETGYTIDIDAIILEYGSFDDFFENDDFSLGELPGTKTNNSQNLMLVDTDSRDISASPLIGGMDVDQKLSPINLTSFETISLPFETFTEDNNQSKNKEATGDVMSPVITANNSLMSSSGEFNQLTKVEAMMTFAPEYAAVDTPTSDFSSSIFKSPYLPRSKNVEHSQTDTKSNVYSMSASSPCVDISEEKPDTNSCNHSLKLYSHIQNVSRKGNQLIEETSSHQVEANAAFALQKKNGRTIEAGNFVMSRKTVLATEIECIMFQAAMGRIRHTLVSFSHRVPFSTTKLQESVMPDSISLVTSTTYDMKKKDSLPARIAGESDIGILDEPLTAHVGVWRSVSVPKGAKPSNIYISENFSLMGNNNNILNDDGKNFSGQRQPLQEILDALPLLVQQSTSFVDVSLDMDDSESSYCWLALQEQKRRGFSCGPSMVHAGCGGLLAMSHSVDIAGVNLVDALSADVYPSSVISLLQSDIKTALKSAFGSLEGPLNLIDWCRGRGQTVDSGPTADGYSYPANDTKELSGIGEPTSPQGSGIRDELYQRRLNQDVGNSESEQQKFFSRVRPTIAALPLPSILVGYQDDWLKASTSCLQFWEKAPLEPYASPKPVTYYTLCPDSTLLTSAAADFFQQLGTVYETCKLGSHSAHIYGNQMELSSEKYLHSGLVLVDCPHQVKTAGKNLFSLSSTSDYFTALSKFWNVKSFIDALTKVIRNLKLTPNISQNQKEGGTNPCTVVYVICPFPEPAAVLQTLLESSVALGSAVAQDRGRSSYLLNQVSKALTSTTSIDESSASNVLMLTGFNIPRLVLQIVTIDCLLQINKPFNELAIMKDIAFTVYNKARRVSRSMSNSDLFPSSSVSGRPHASLLHVGSPISGMWKDCSWDNSWQTSNKSPEIYPQEDLRYVFEPLFILAEPGSLERGSSSNMLSGVGLEYMSSKSAVDESSGVYMQNDVNDGLEQDKTLASLHCCYGWTEDWRWLICVWTDSRGELLDCNIFPFGGISSCQDTKVLQSLFVQILQQGCQILSSSSDSGTVRPRDIIVTRIGCFFELECQEWQNAIYSVGGNDIRKWPLQLRRPTPEILSSNSNGTSLQQHELGLMQERNLPSSPSSSLYSPRAKSGFTKSSLSQANNKKQLLAGQASLDNSRGYLQFVQSISLVGVCIDHSLLLMLPADSPSSGTGSQTSNISNANFSNYVEGFSAVKSLGSTPTSYMIIPSPNLRSLTPTPLQLPTCLTSESPPLAHLLHSKGSAIPLSTGFVVSKAVPAIRKDSPGPATPKSDWPSVVSVSLIDHYGSSSLNIQDKTRGKQSRSLGSETVSGRDYEFETHFVLESVAAELHALSWMTTSPVYLERRSALPFHCDMLLRLRRLLHYADAELSRPRDPSL